MKRTEVYYRIWINEDRQISGQAKTARRMRSIVRHLASQDPRPDRIVVTRIVTSAKKSHHRSIVKPVLDWILT